MAPWFCTVSQILNVLPGAAAVGGSVTAVTTRSGRVTWIVAAEARQLFDSFAWITAPESSAHASTWYSPSGVAAGTTTLGTVPVDDAPAAREGTVRAPLSRRSPAPFCESLDR